MRCSNPDCHRGELSPAEFNFKSKITGKRQSRCRICTKAQIRNHYIHNKQYYINKARRHNQAMLTLVREAKSVPCADCGIQYPYYVMDLDHINGDKEFCLAEARKYGSARIRAELQKCEAVCANCHRERSFASN